MSGRPQLPRSNPDPVLFVTCILCQRLHRAARGLGAHPVCPACQRGARR